MKVDITIAFDSINTQAKKKLIEDLKSFFSNKKIPYNTNSDYPNEITVKIEIVDENPAQEKLNLR